MATPILVTGASGNVGSELVKYLRQRGQPVRIAQRTRSAQDDYGDGVETVQFDFKDPHTFASAFAGVERMFLVRPPAISDARRFIFPAIDAARQAGVRHIVFLSVIGTEKNRIVPHYKIEQYIQRSGLNYTFLRASFFMQNLNTVHRAEIKDEHMIYVPAGRGKTSFVDVRDVAAVAALALTTNGHARRAYALTGSEAFDYDEVARILSEVLARPIIYRNPSLLSFIWREHKRGTPLPLILVMAAIYTTARLGLAGRITEDTERLLDRAPIPFKQYVEDYRTCWLKSSQS